jgi:signal transduction histidine kinase
MSRVPDRSSVDRMPGLDSARARAARWGDWILVAVLLGAAQFEIWVRPLFDNGIPGSRVASAALFVALTVPLAWRRRAPALVLCVVVASVLVGASFGEPSDQAPLEGFLAALVAFYSVGAHCERRRALLAGAIGGGTIILADLAGGLLGSGGSADVGGWIALAIAWLAGRVLSRGRIEARGLRERARRLEREREEQARLAVAEERMRIARELHDAIAHSVSVMVVQAAAAQQVLPHSPDRATDALVAIQDTGRQAVVELRRMLGILRAQGESPSLAPEPGVAALEDLVAQVREVGLPVALTVEGEAKPLSSGVDRSAYRIVQEALTNTLKHAGPATAEVTLRYREGALEIDVLEDGLGATDGRGGGFGLAGMRERATLYGGALESGPRPGRGYALHASLPLERRQP